MTPISKPTATISELRFYSGSVISLNPDDKVIIVGPNNSGKSQSLKDILNIVSDESILRSGKCISDIKLRKTGTLDELIFFLESNGKNTSNSNN